MPFVAEITRANPSCFLFLLDQSGSMQDRIGGAEGVQRKCDVVADAINRLLQEIAVRCAKEDGIRDYFYISVIGYGASVGPALSGSLSGRDSVAIGEIAVSPTRVEARKKKMSDGAGGIIEQTIKFPVWVDPVANGGTPMCKALDLGRGIIDRWINLHPSSYPPVVLNLTDGESTDGSPADSAEQLRGLYSADGPALLFNLHVSSGGNAPITFPDNEASLPNEYARQLFRISSVLPEGMRQYAGQQGFPVSDGTRGFVFNADITSIVQFLDIGTRATRHLLR